MRSVYKKTMKHNREVNVMKGFIEVMNRIREICSEHENCYGCPLLDTDHVKEVSCIISHIPENNDPLEIMRRLQEYDK